MKRKSSKFFAALISVIVAVSVLTVTVFAADTKGLSSGLKKYLSNPENTQFDFSDTSVVDNDADWTVFVLSRCGEKDVYPEYSEYINNAVKENYASLKPSDLARITLSVKAYGLDPENIGGKDLISALKSVDYSSQTYMSSITYPLTALNFAEENISAEMLDTMLKTIIAGQQSDGGFPYCTEDTGYGISSDVDTTAMTVQALAKYYNTDERVKDSVDKALAYIKTQQFDDGSFGYVAWNSKSGESTSQVIIALCMLGIDPTGSEYSKADGNPVSALAHSSILLRVRRLTTAISLIHSLLIKCLWLLIPTRDLKTARSTFTHLSMLRLRNPALIRRQVPHRLPKPKRLKQQPLRLSTFREQAVQT